MSTKKRIPAKDFWELVELTEAGMEAGKAWEKWRRDYLKIDGRYLDEVDFVSGLVRKLESDGTYVNVKHISQKELEDARGRMLAVGEANDGVNSKLMTLAKRYRLMPDQINPRTGEISTKDWEEVALAEKESEEGLE